MTNQIAELSWLNTILDSPSVRELCDWLKQTTGVIAEGASGSSSTLLAGALSLKMSRPVLLVVAHLDDADDVVEDLQLFAQWGADVRPSRFGALEVLPGESNISLELLAERLSVVEQVVKHPRQLHEPWVIVAPIQALMQSIPEPGAIREFTLALQRGDKFPPARLLDWLDQAGYNRTESIEQPGDFATRGGIIDIYLPSSATPDLRDGPTPVRVDYFGDEIDSLNIIDTDTMGSGKELQLVQLIGASAKRLQSDDRTTTLLQLLPENTLIIMNELLELSEQARGYYERLTNPRGVYSPTAVIKLLTQRPYLLVNQYSATSTGEVIVKLPVRPLPPFDHDAATAVKELSELAQQDCCQVVTLCQRPAERDRLTELVVEHAAAARDAIRMDIGYLHRGFVWQENSGQVAEWPSGQVKSKKQSNAKHLAAGPLGHSVTSLLLIPHHELFHRYETRRRIRRISLSSERATDAFLDLDVGDYVVHVDHGIARFKSLRAMTRGGVTEDFLTLEFANEALLHVPATQIDLVQKYIGGFEGRPPLSMLGGKRWGKQKEAAAEAAKDLAKQMLRVQAARAAMPGIRFPADTPWQNEFEAEFPYQETEDQLAAIAEVKKDMADDQPMDRLICGDVGFGKTEVAIRAAFKAVEFGKQVAVLVPTTVLAEQHERTFRSRMAEYPFIIESLSRFKTAGEQNKTLEKLARGEVDIIIGTHRLLSKDVKFADLGLVIVDEEQRFGVEHKQKLLEFRLTADVLTLTATPIPRTLHMSMLGLRDISSLSTPPLDRRAIVTEVVPYDQDRIRQALIRELNREGQVFFVHNRVYDIESVADEIQKLVPDARIIIGHGQMPGHELEQIMLKFIRREADILVSTTIIESGIDIPTANTMFINDADHFGLADLHQLRGRVGRYKHRAYCYLLLPGDRAITETAQRRLKAIEQYAMLGAGFKIAMRDLEIRGAGNLLGAEQSGHIAAVGYEMYCMLLEQESKRLKNEQLVDASRMHLDLPSPAGGVRIGPKWINSEKHRMDAYKRFSRADSFQALDKVVKDLTDAYGEPPAQTLNLIAMCELRVAASILNIRSIKLDGPDLIFRTNEPQKLDPLLKDAPGRASVIDADTVYYRPPANYLEPATLLVVLRKILVTPLRG